MNTPPAFQFYPDDFLGGTVSMSNEEKGMYITALCIQWNKGGVSEDEMARLGRGIAVPSLNHVKGKFKLCSDSLFRNQRLEQERRKQREYRENRKKSGELGAKTRWHSHSTAMQQPMAKNSSPSPSPSPSTEHERESHFAECNGNPTLKEVLSKADMIGLLPWKAEDWFNEMQGCGWLDFHHRPIKDWAAVLTRVKVKWEADGRPTSPPKAKTSPNGERPKSPLDLRTIIQAKEATASDLRNRYCSETAIDSVWSDNSKKQEFFNIKRDIKKLTAQLGNMA